MIFTQEQAQRVRRVLEDLAALDADTVLTFATCQLRYFPAERYIELTASIPPVELIAVDPITGAIGTRHHIQVRERYRDVREFAAAYGLPHLPRNLKDIWTM